MIMPRLFDESGLLAYARKLLDEQRAELRKNPLALLTDQAMQRALDKAHLENLERAASPRGGGGAESGSAAAGDRIAMHREAGERTGSKRFEPLHSRSNARPAPLIPQGWAVHDGGKK